MITMNETVYMCGLQVMLNDTLQTTSQPRTQSEVQGTLVGSEHGTKKAQKRNNEVSVALCSGHNIDT